MFDPTHSMEAVGIYKTLKEIDDRTKVPELDNRPRPEHDEYETITKDVVISWDPNEIKGPLGEGAKRYKQQGDWMDYTIYFENKTNATAAAQEVFVDLPMDENLDWSTLELGEIAFGDHIDTGLQGKSHGKASYPLPGTNTLVKTVVTMKDGVLSWYLRDWDPTTADNFPASATGGFLPPNDPETHCGEGHLSFRVRVKDNAPNGAVIRASAQIVFDSNPMIETDPSWWNTVGEFKPEVAFDEAELSCDEGGAVSVSVSGGSEEAETSVKVYLTYGTAKAADLSLGKVKYPITLKWAKGEVTNKTFTVKVKTDSIAEGFETFALQLANPVGMTLGDAHVCTVTIKDKTSSLTLAEGLNNGLISPSCAKSSKWTAVESYKSDTNESKRTYVQSPAVAAGKSSTLTAGTFKGKGYIHFSLKFTGNDNGKKKAAVKVYDGKKLLGTINTTQNGSDWHGWYALCSGTGTHVIKFVFVQGSVKSVRMRLTDIWWEPYDGRPAWQIYATTSKLNGGYVGGQGIYADGTKITLKPRLRAGYEFDYWYDYYNDTVLDSPATLSLTVATNGYYVAYVKYTPVVRGLPETASGGTVSGGGMCASGKRVTLTAKPAKNHTFEGWYASKDGNENEIDEEAFVSKAVSLAVDRTAKPVAPTAKLFVVTGLTESVTYFAKFKPYPKVTVAVEGAKGGTVKGAGSYLAGKTVTLTATQKKGYAFTGWYDGLNLVTLAATYKYKMTADGAALSAGFKKEGELTRPEFVWNGATNLAMGVNYSAALAASGESAVSITKVAGLPKGLAYKSGKVSGAPAKAGSFTATVTVTLVSNKKKTWIYKVKLAVAALPAFAQGTFNGWTYEPVEGGGQGLPALPVRKVTVSVTSAGKITAKVGTLSFARTGWMVGGNGLYTATLSKTRTVGSGKKAKKYKDVLTLVLDPDKEWTDDQLSGAFETFLTTALDAPVNADAVVSARRNPFGDKNNLEAKAVAAGLAVRGTVEIIDKDGVAWKLKVSAAGVATISRTTGAGKKKKTVSATAVVEVDADGIASARFLVGGKVLEVKLDCKDLLIITGHENGE